MQFRRGVVVFVLLSWLLLSRANSQVFGNNIPGTSITEGEAIGIVVGSAAAITVVTIVLVHNSHPTLKGCVTAGPGGMLMHNEGDQKTYALTGTTASLKVGDIVKVKGKKYKKQKDSAGNEEFAVTQAGKDYGPCKAP
ncbi:MAG TPA: hypothetical protein VJX73_04655 [Terracidiphilus sp.]|nr:hypothetical protein [Terracidiphilus sp.]